MPPLLLTGLLGELAVPLGLVVAVPLVGLVEGEVPVTSPVPDDPVKLPPTALPESLGICGDGALAEGAVGVTVPVGDGALAEGGAVGATVPVGDGALAEVGAVGATVPVPPLAELPVPGVVGAGAEGGATVTPSPLEVGVVVGATLGL